MNSYLFIFSACYSDYFYQNRGGARYPYHGGYTNHGNECGAFDISIGGKDTNSGISIGAALSFKLD